MVSCFKHGSKKNGFSIKQGQGLKGSVTHPKLHFKPLSSAISYGNVRKLFLVMIYSILCQKKSKDCNKTRSTQGCQRQHALCRNHQIQHAVGLLFC